MPLKSVKMCFHGVTLKSVKQAISCSETFPDQKKNVVLTFHKMFSKNVPRLDIKAKQKRLQNVFRNFCR